MFPTFLSTDPWYSKKKIVTVHANCETFVWIWTEVITANCEYSVASVTPDTLLVCGSVYLYEVNGWGKTFSALHSNLPQS